MDSGVGGFTVCQAIRARLPALEIIYFADDNGFPYGLLAEDVLKNRLINIIAHILRQHQVDLVVVACNTASTSVLPDLRSRFDIPFVGVVPAIKPAAQLSNSRCIGLLATPATVSRPYTDQLISDYASDCQIVKVGSTELVEMAEQKLLGHDPDPHALAAILTPFKKDSIGFPGPDCIVLGCTHFPILRQDLNQILPAVSWLDSGEAIASRVDSLLGDRSELKLQNRMLKHKLYFSGKRYDSEAFDEILTSIGMETCERICNALDE